MTTTITTEKQNGDMKTTTKQELAALDVRRQALEQEAQAITEELTSPTGDNGDGPPMGVDTPLVDSDGYPRSDIDIYRARSLRKRLAEIKTNHKQLMLKVEQLLQQLSRLSSDGTNQPTIVATTATTSVAAKPKPKFDPISGKWVVKNSNGTIAGAGSEHEHRQFDSIDSSTTPPVAQLAQVGLGAAAATATPTPTMNANTNTTPTTTTTSATRPPLPSKPFAKVDAVSEQSPAAQAGLQEGDVIFQFGDISHATTDPFHELAQLVPRAAGQQEAIAIAIQRGDQVHHLQLTPRPWNGRGLLGCHVVPLTDA